jgi:hypothetical protein
MDRMSNRSVVPEVVSELRDELREVRRELREFNEIVTSSTSSAEIEARTKQISESFAAIVPESRMSRAQRFKRRISMIQGLVRPILKFMAGFVMQTGMPYDKIHADAQGIPNLISEGRAITDRTITAKTFAGLASGLYKGRKPSIDGQELRRLVGEGLTPTQIAGRLKIARQSVYSVLKGAVA